MANEVLFTLLDETDEDPQVWYLMGYASVLESAKCKGDDAEDALTNAREYLQNAQTVISFLSIFIKTFFLFNLKMSKFHLMTISKTKNQESEWVDISGYKNALET